MLPSSYFEDETALFIPYQLMWLDTDVCNVLGMISPATHGSLYCIIVCLKRPEETKIDTRPKFAMWRGVMPTTLRLRRPIYWSEQISYFPELHCHCNSKSQGPCAVEVEIFNIGMPCLKQTCCYDIDEYTWVSVCIHVYKWYIIRRYEVEMYINVHFSRQNIMLTAVLYFSDNAFMP